MQLGIVHIIAISGMHLDLLFKTLKSITSQLPNRSFFKIFELLFLLFCVWTYTLIARASPSIIRASIVFSFFIVGKYYKLSSFNLNTIAAGILTICLFNAKSIENIGLQLSYAAVIGIHFFYKLLNSALSIDNPIIQMLWSNCSISIAAQLTTLPILLIHFHQIASWALVCNFIMVPLSNLILYGLGCILILPTQFAIYFGSFVSRYIQFFNGIVYDWYIHTKANKLFINMDFKLAVVYYIILFLIYSWFLQKKSSYMIIILSILTGYSIVKLFS
jgi:competence protein ComEC